MYCISLLNVQQKFWINLSACVVLLEYEIELVLTGHCFLWDEKQSRHLIYLPSSQGGPTTVAEKCQVLWILCCKVHFYMHGSDRWVSVQTSEKMYQSVNYLSGPCRQPRIVSKDWNLCPEETQKCKIQMCSAGNMMQGRSSARYLFMIRSILWVILQSPVPLLS